MGLTKKLLKALGLVTLLVVAVVIINTLSQQSKQIQVATNNDIKVDDSAVKRLSGAITFETDSSRFDTNPEPFKAFREYLAAQYPLIHQRLTREIVNDYALLFRWPGKNPAIKPMVLMAHMDVVPAPKHTYNMWTHPPFSGAIDGDFVYGRGSMDDKASLIAILEAVEMRLRDGYTPERDIYLVFGHDEEVSGLKGAGSIAKLFKERDIRPAFVLDEGLAITQGILPVDKPVALIGVAEKGYATYKLQVDYTGGHSSMPAKETSIGVLSHAISRLEPNPFDKKLQPPASWMLEYLAQDVPFAERMVFGNLWLFSPIVAYVLSASPETNATLRTTLAPTILKSGFAENVLPTRATAVVNARIYPGDTVSSTQRKITEAIDDERVRVSIDAVGSSEPSPVASIDGVGFYSIQKSLMTVFPDILVAPGLMIATSDSRFFVDIADDVYRFGPFKVTPADISRIHGIDERVSIANFKDGIRFYYRLMGVTDE